MIRVEVVYALREEQMLVELEVPEGTTVRDAVGRSGLLRQFPEDQAVGLWGRVVPPETPLRDGDRVEIYRSLTVEPKEARRRNSAPSGGGQGGRSGA